MQLQEIQINDTTVSQEDSTPRVSFNVDITLLCSGDLEQYKVNGNLDTTSLKDAALKLLQNKLNDIDDVAR
ncbi:hypothetical protein [Sphingobacterium deserti]|uniref:Uncharacterized protein n=1 Tax=Sphingobacterium deserti TaxID=1229276 RepID=A0A0B8T0X8_9SPHI|nr:hypothetical protein [Sphingobacterium deserti]KGE12263.1 hypothetical protein DI53_3913 [Sphingobacterium deserti]